MRRLTRVPPSTSPSRAGTRRGPRSPLAPPTRTALDPRPTPRRIACRTRGAADLRTLADLDPLAEFGPPVAGQMDGQRTGGRAGGGILATPSAGREHPRLDARAASRRSSSRRPRREPRVRRRSGRSARHGVARRRAPRTRAAGRCRTPRWGALSARRRAPPEARRRARTAPGRDRLLHLAERRRARRRARARPGSRPAPVSSRTASQPVRSPSTNAVPSTGWPAKGSSVAGVKIRTRAPPRPRRGSTNTVSDRLSSRAARCMSSPLEAGAVVNTATGLPSSGTSVNTSTIMYARIAHASAIASSVETVVQFRAVAVTPRPLPASLFHSLERATPVRMPGVDLAADRRRPLGLDSRLPERSPTSSRELADRKLTWYRFGSVGDLTQRVPLDDRGQLVAGARRRPAPRSRTSRRSASPSRSSSSAAASLGARRCPTGRRSGRPRSRRREQVAQLSHGHAAARAEVDAAEQNDLRSRHQRRPQNSCSCPASAAPSRRPPGRPAPARPRGPPRSRSRSARRRSARRSPRHRRASAGRRRARLAPAERARTHGRRGRTSRSRAGPAG